MKKAPPEEGAFLKLWSIPDQALLSGAVFIGHENFTARIAPLQAMMLICMYLNIGVVCTGASLRKIRVDGFVMG